MTARYDSIDELMQRPPPAVRFGAASPPKPTRNWGLGRSPNDVASALHDKRLFLTEPYQSDINISD
jgi:hypothetical protein